MKKKKARKIEPRERGPNRTDYNPTQNLVAGGRTNEDSIPTIEQMKLVQPKGLRDLNNVPGILLAHKRRRKVSENEVCFYLILMQYANGKGVIPGTYDAVQEMTGAARRTVSKVLCAMERKGMLVRRFIPEKGKTLIRLNPCDAWRRM